MADEEREQEKREKGRRERIIVASTVVSAIAAVVSALGIIAAFGQMMLMRYQITDDDRKVAIEALRSWASMQPPNAAACIDLFGRLEIADLATIAARHPLTLANAASRDLVGSCFADQDAEQLNALYDGATGRLSPTGVSLFAARINAAINADETLALAAQHDVADADMIIEELTDDLTDEELAGIRKLRTIRGRERAWPAILWIERQIELRRKATPVLVVGPTSD